MAATDIRVSSIENLAPASVGEDAADAVVFEDAEATAFVRGLNSGTATAAYLRDADSLFASIFRSESANGLFSQ